MVTLGFGAVTTFAVVMLIMAAVSDMREPGQIWFLMAPFCYLAMVCWLTGFTVAWCRRWSTMRLDEKSRTYADGYGGETLTRGPVPQGLPVNTGEASEVSRQAS